LSAKKVESYMLVMHYFFACNLVKKYTCDEFADIILEKRQSAMRQLICLLFKFQWQVSAGKSTNPWKSWFTVVFSRFKCELYSPSWILGI